MSAMAIRYQETVDPDTGKRFNLPVIEVPKPNNDNVVKSFSQLTWNEKEEYRRQGLMAIYADPNMRRLHNHQEIIDAKARLIFYGVE